MSLITPEGRARLLQNGRRQATAMHETWDEIDFAPVVNLRTTDSSCAWLLTELDPADTDLAFGLYDLGVGELDVGYVRLSNLETFHGLHGVPVEPDPAFATDRPLSAYVRDARRRGRISP